MCSCPALQACEWTHQNGEITILSLLQRDHLSLFSSHRLWVVGIFMLTVRHPQRRHFLLAACHTDYRPRPTPLSIVVPSAGNFSRKWRMDHSCHWFTAINLRHRDHSAVMSATVVTAVARQIDCPASPLLLWPELPPVRT